ncbi:MAG: hypothetical protein JO154_00860 [Chitinophaga sp.]|uniref:hypothetical protein n=1 Tax=Chitinophaga sp. TaxID=1869181 RepID=UPI0025C28DA5|nr:hypothetical protein [Chitinophaga sp.]MBV8251125.1 hypothetical protein [Chitinophaga sp.]
MYAPFIFLSACIITYLLYRSQTLRKSMKKKRQYQPWEGEDAMVDARIVGISNQLFPLSRYMRSLRNNSHSRWITVAVKQIIRTDMGTTCDTRLITNIAPGEERRLGHADDVQEGKYRIFIGYEIIWARYTPVPKWFQPKPKRFPTPAEMYDEVMRKYKPQPIRELEQQEGPLSDGLWP